MGTSLQQLEQQARARRWKSGLDQVELHCARARPVREEELDNADVARLYRNTQRQVCVIPTRGMHIDINARCREHRCHRTLRAVKACNEKRRPAVHDMRKGHAQVVLHGLTARLGLASHLQRRGSEGHELRTKARAWVCALRYQCAHFRVTRAAGVEEHDRPQARGRGQRQKREAFIDRGTMTTPQLRRVAE